MIEQACREMEAGGKIKITKTSGLWETAAMYVLEQDKFLNGVCEISTNLTPIELLDELQEVENRMGRVKIIDKGPRNIDLDILLYDRITHKDDRLQIPHPLMHEREFVLRPLCQLIGKDTRFDPYGLPFNTLLHRLPKPETLLSTVIPMASHTRPIRALDTGRDTRIMSILNVTPDSFSDGGQNYDVGKVALTDTIKSHIAAGATIIDVGGQSTRPGAEQVSPEEELKRIIPAIDLIRSLPDAQHVAISVDTYRADVAEASIKAGADIINDVSAGLLDDQMLPTVARLGCTICLMHMRGTPATMTTLTEYPEGLIKTVGAELLDRVRAAEAAGIRRWRILLDPGVGFAKTANQNLDILRWLHNLCKQRDLRGIPWLVGTSRKAFIGKITGVEAANDRVWGTAAAVTTAIAGGADIVRVHDVQEMAQVAKMADAIWRKPRRQQEPR
ncbi:trifunctional dihydropteroate synthetase [Coniothyrium glycines]